MRVVFVRLKRKRKKVCGSHCLSFLSFRRRIFLVSVISNEKKIFFSSQVNVWRMFTLMNLVSYHSFVGGGKTTIISRWWWWFSIRSLPFLHIASMFDGRDYKSFVSCFLFSMFFFLSPPFCVYLHALTSASFSVFLFFFLRLCFLSTSV